MAAGHIVDIWHRHAITLVLTARVQRGCIPLRDIAGTMGGEYNLEKSIVTLETNTINRRMLTPEMQCGGGGALACLCSGEYSCGVASDRGSESGSLS